LVGSSSGALELAHGCTASRRAYMDGGKSGGEYQQRLQRHGCTRESEGGAEESERDRNRLLRMAAVRCATAALLCGSN
jgi:hypothetical protein